MVLIVDDNALVRRTLRACIEQNTDLQVCGEAENGEIALKKVQELNPDIVILDMQMPGLNGLETARQIATIAPDTPIIMFTMHSCDQLLKEAEAAGIRTVVSKSAKVTDHLLPALRNLVSLARIRSS